MTPVTLATEDELSEAVGTKLLEEHPVLVQLPPMKLRKGGSGYLRSRMDSWRQLAMRQVVVVLTDLDRMKCSVALRENWLGADRGCPENLLLRVAEREVESWLLADHDACKKLIGSTAQLPAAPDMLPDPKQHLLLLAKRAPRAIREDLIAQKGSVARQGIGYNNRLVEWVKNEWSPQKAAERSPSLARARYALRVAASKVGSQ